MHIPAYAHATIQNAIPTEPTVDQERGLHCCFCGTPFEDGAPVPLSSVAESDLSACHSCLTGLVARARELRDTALTEEASRVGTELATWMAKRDRYIARIDRVRQAAAAVTQLAGDSDLEPLRAAWLHVSLESAYAWATADKPELSLTDSSDTSPQEAELGLFIEMTLAREAVADRLAYHLINKDSPAEPEMCAEFECPTDCSGKHEISEVDCGPDAIFEDLMEHGISCQSPQRNQPGGDAEAKP